jgi:hypothetical protein
MSNSTSQHATYAIKRTSSLNVVDYFIATGYNASSKLAMTFTKSTALELCRMLNNYDDEHLYDAVDVSA